MNIAALFYGYIDIVDNNDSSTIFLIPCIFSLLRKAKKIKKQSETPYTPNEKQ